MADNAITIVGTVTMDPELRKTGTGMSVLEVNFAGPKKRKFNRDTNQWENVEDDPQYFSGVAFGDLADNANATITKGMRVVIVGKLNYSSWQDKDENNRSKVQIVIDEISPSLRFASATVNRQELNSEPVARENYEEDEAPF